MCGACHYQFPTLTPFDRLFKMNGYVLTGLKVIEAGGDTTSRQTLSLAPIPPVSAMIVASLTRTRETVSGTQNNDAAGRSASANNRLYLYTWIAF